MAKGWLRRRGFVYRRPWARGAAAGDTIVTDRLALILALILAAFIGADLVLTGGETLLYLARKFVGLMDWVEFWR